MIVYNCPTVQIHLTVNYDRRPPMVAVAVHDNSGQGLLPRYATITLEQTAGRFRPCERPAAEAISTEPLPDSRIDRTDKVTWHESPRDLSAKEILQLVGDAHVATLQEFGQRK